MNIGLAFDVDMTTINASAVVLVPVIVAVVQGIKMTGWVKDKFAPLVSIAVGVILAFIAGHNNADLSGVILSGCMFGLMASGLYSGVRSTVGNTNNANSTNQPVNSTTSTTSTKTTTETTKTDTPEDPLI